MKWFVEYINGRIVKFDRLGSRWSYMVAAASRHPDIINDKTVYMKIYCMNELYDIEDLEKELQLHEDVKHLNISPPLISCQELLRFKVGYLDGEEKIYEDPRLGVAWLITIERYGKSLSDKYFNSEIGGPGPSARNLDDETFDSLFPSERIPEDIRTQIRPLLQILKELGWCHDDIHVGNFVVRDDIVKIIDFNCISRI